MATLGRLLPLITHLQSEDDVALGRQILLKYVGESSGAQLVALFLLDKEHQMLELLSYIGEPPPFSSSSRTTSTASPEIESDLGHIPLNGLFGSVLLTQDFLSVADLQSDPRTLPVERLWGRGRVLLSAVKAGKRSDDEQGVCLLCFAPTGTPGQGRTLTMRAGEQVEADLSVCLSLLSAYLSRIDLSRARPSRVLASLDEEEIGHEERPRENVVEPLYTEEWGQQQDFSAALAHLGELCAVGLAVSVDVSIEEVYQHILTHLLLVTRGRGASLFLYQPLQRQFLSVATQGKEPPAPQLSTSLNVAEIERLALRNPSEALAVIDVNSRLLLVPLCLDESVVAVVALVGVPVEVLSSQRTLVLAYMGKIAALLLRNYEVRRSERQEAMERERNRIAHDLHDGVVQQLTHVLHKLEFVQYMLDKPAAQTPSVASEIKRTYNILQTSLHDLRSGISSLLPVQLEKQGLVAALTILLDEFCVNVPGLQMAFEHDDLRQLPSSLEVAVFRLVQEALNNVQKHAHASHVSVHLRLLPRMLLVEISDNGIGFRVEQDALRIPSLDEKAQGVPRLGLRTMRERVQELGGNWEIRSTPGEGTTVKARFPLITTATVLTKREHEVLRLIVGGLTNRAIAEQLSISMETVKSHVHHIMQKMQVKDRTQAAVVAARQGWL